MYLGSNAVAHRRLCKRLSLIWTSLNTMSPSRPQGRWRPASSLSSTLLWKNQNHKNYFQTKKFFLRREPWSSGYEMRLIYQRLWVRFPAPYTGWTWHFFTLICCKNFNDVCLKSPKINEKEAGVGPFFKKKVFFFSLRQYPQDGLTWVTVASTLEPQPTAHRSPTYSQSYNHNKKKQGLRQGVNLLGSPLPVDLSLSQQHIGLQHTVLQS